MIVDFAMLSFQIQGAASNVCIHIQSFNAKFSKTLFLKIGTSCVEAYWREAYSMHSEPLEMSVTWSLESGQSLVKADLSIWFYLHK